MFTLYYFIIIKVARSVGLRICSSFRIWWECPWAKSRIKERNERRRTGWHMPVQSASWVRTLACWSDTWFPKTSGAVLRHNTFEKVNIFLKFQYFIILLTFAQIYYSKKKFFSKKWKSILIFIYISIGKVGIYILR